MDKENIYYKIRDINTQIWLAHKYIQAKLNESSGTFSFIEKFTNKNDLDTFFSWQLQINIEIVFVKICVFLEFLKELKLDSNYKIDQDLAKAGLRAYVAHKGTQKNFKKLCLPPNTLVIPSVIEIINDKIFFTLLSGNHTEPLSKTATHKINLTEKIFEPHLNFVKENYPDWLK